MPEGAQQSAALLALLEDAGLDFVVIGGVAAIAWGATEFTRDLDVAMEFSVDGLTRLMNALAPHRPRHLTRPDLPGIAETPSALANFRSLLLTCDLGRLDVLRDVPPLGRYADFAPRCVTVEAFGRERRIIGLDDLIAIKDHVARPKDVLVAAQLKAIRAARASESPTR